MRFIQLQHPIWLEYHNDPRKVSASQVATILGENPWMSPLELFLMKRGDIPWPKQNLAMGLGHTLEDIIAGHFEDERGVKLFNPGDCAIAECPEFPGLFCTVDRTLISDPDPEGDRVVEIKTGNQYVKKNWNEGPPMGYRLQNQTQMLCTGAKTGSIAAFLGDNFKLAYGLSTSKDSMEDLMQESGVEYRDFDYEFHQPLSENILKYVEDFIRRCVDNDAPDALGRDIPVLKILHPMDNGAVKQGVGGVADIFTSIGNTKGDIKASEKYKKDREAAIIQIIGDNSYLASDGLCMSYKHQTRAGSISISTKDQENYRNAWEVLDSHGIKFKETKDTTFRVLRECKMPTEG